MRDWRNLTQEERKAERDKIPGEYARKQIMNANMAATLDLLKDDQFAQAKAWKVSFGSYLINTPEEIAAHCRAAAHKKHLTLSLLGRDSWDRPVYNDGTGRLLVDVDPRNGRSPDICTKQGNSFEGEPSSPVDAIFTFVPYRDTW